MSLVKNIYNKFDQFKIPLRYKKKLFSLKYKIHKNIKIRVLFLVRENSKWSYDSLYKLMKESKIFDPIIVVSLLTSVVEGLDTTRNNLEDNYLFFSNLGYNVVYGYSTFNKKFIDLKIYSPDIVFYDQLWELPEIHTPKNISFFALTFYCSYSYEILDDENNYTNYFHKYLYKYLVEHKYNLERYEKYKKGNSTNCVVVGYPKLDTYLENKKKNFTQIWKNPKKFKIIYAPHHSFENNGLKFATFKQNGNFILSLAKKLPQTTWILKPHPRFKHALLTNKIMTQKEIEDYYEEWERIGIIYDKGNYFDIFKTSDLMITDCCSFLVEYLPTNKPLIRLCNENSMQLNKLGQHISKCFIEIFDNQTLEQTLRDLITVSLNNITPNTAIVNEIIDFKESSAQKIINYILNNITE